MKIQLLADVPGRRGWIVLATTFITLALVVGIWYSSSVFLVAFLRESGWSRSVIAGDSRYSSWFTDL